MDIDTDDEQEIGEGDKVYQNLREDTDQDHSPDRVVKLTGDTPKNHAKDQSHTRMILRTISETPTIIRTAKKIEERNSIRVRMNNRGSYSQHNRHKKTQTPTPVTPPMTQV